MTPKYEERKDKFQIGDVYWMQFDGIDSEQKGFRPGVVFQNNTGNKHSPNIIALPLTSAVKQRRQPTHVPLDKERYGLSANSTILCEAPQRMSKRRVYNKLSELDFDAMKKVAISSMLSSSVIAYLDESELVATWKEAKRLNGIN